MSNEQKPTPGPWRVGKQGNAASFSTVVSDHPVPEVGGSDAVEYYGGHMVAESVAPKNARFIAAAPETAAERDRLKETNAELLGALLPFAEACATKSDPGTFDLDDDQPQAWHVPLGAWRAAARAIAKAKGGE